MEKACIKCSQNFPIAKEDTEFYSKFSLPLPSKCPDCRSQQRMSFRNERTLYKRKCDLCHKDSISMLSEDKPFLVYCQSCYWSDRWDATNYSEELNWSEPFFQQFQKLMLKTPRLALVNKQSENSEYCNYSFANKNCYLNFGSHYEEDCLYGHYSTKNKNCVDFMWLYNCELCYECLFSKRCYRCVELDQSENCLDCFFSFDLKDCKNCLFSANLRHKEYMIFNEPHSKEDYFKHLALLNLSNYESFQNALKTYITEVRQKFPMRGSAQVNCENCEGSTHENSKNLRYSFNCTNCEDCAYSYQMDETNSSMDCDFMGYDRSERCFQAIGCSGIYNCIVCDSCWHNNDLFYCELCFSSKNCFGCISLNRKQYCILNKQYSKEDYEKLLIQIKEHMKKTGEWGEFFPSELSPFNYEETVAQEHFPQETKRPQTPSESGCISCGKAFNMIPQELEFYKKMNLPAAKKCPLCRYEDRARFRRPRGLFKRPCSKCGTEIKSCYSAEGPEIVYCEKCFLENVY